jgi:transposase
MHDVRQVDPWKLQALWDLVREYVSITVYVLASDRKIEKNTLVGISTYYNWIHRCRIDCIACFETQQLIIVQFRRVS